jgi:hypothetical protein
MVGRVSGGLSFGFPKYLLTEQGHSVTLGSMGEVAVARPASAACYVYLPPACYRFMDDEVETDEPTRSPHVIGAPVRADCGPLVDQAEDPAESAVARRVDVPNRRAEYDNVVGERPLVGFLPCRAGAVVPPRVITAPSNGR